MANWELSDFYEAWPGDFKHYVYICKVPDKTLKHDDRYFLFNESDAVLMKPIDMLTWIKHKTVATAIDPDTQKPYEYCDAPVADIKKRIDFPVKFYDSIEKNIPVEWKLNETSWKHLKLIVEGSHYHCEHLFGLLNAELTSQSISKQMIVMF